MVRKWKIFVVVALVAGCASENEIADRLEGFGVSIDESAISSTIAERTLRTTFSIARRSQTAIEGQLDVRLVEISSGTTVNRVTKKIAIAKTTTKTTVALQLAKVLASSAELGGLILDFRLDLPDGQLHGRRSVYMTVRHSQLGVIGDNRFIVGEPAVLRAYVRDQFSGAPLVEQDVSIEFQRDKGKSTTLATGKTDAQGEFVGKFSFDAGAEGSGTIVVRAGVHQSSHSGAR